MENIDIKPEKQGIFKPALIHALMISGALIIYTLILYLSGQMQNRWLGFFAIVIAFGGTIYALIAHRDQNLGGYVSYGQCVVYALTMGVIIGVVTGAFSFILYQYLAPELIFEMTENAEKEILKSNPNMPEDQLEMALKFTKFFLKPWVMLVSSIFGGVFQGLIFGLIGGIFVKKTIPNPLVSMD